MTQPGQPAAGSLHGSGRREMPNFDYVRLVAASSVIFSHSFTIAQGDDRGEPLVRLLGEGEILGIYAVCVFFIVSGFLVTKSACERRSLIAFAKARLLRVMPGLFVCQLLTALVLGTLFTSLAKHQFVESLIWLKYAIRYTLDPAMSWQVDTVTFYVDAHKNGEGLNGSLWTIEQELICYAIVALLLVTRLLRWQTFLLIVALTLPFLVPWGREDSSMLMDLIDWRIEEARVENFFWVAPSFFMGGAIYFLWARKQSLPAWPLLLCAADFAWAVHRGHTYDHFALYGAYPILRFATAARYRLPSLKKFGDISYGIYLYGWPMQQAVRGFAGEGVSWHFVFLVSLSLAAICGYLSWHWVERPALQFKNRALLPPWLEPKALRARFARRNAAE